MSEFCTIKTKEIVNGRQLMYFNESLESWDSDLDLLENGYGLAACCYNLMSFNAITPKLKNAEGMFTEVGNPTWSDGSTVRSIKIDYDTIENAQRMFENCGTIELVSRKPLGSFLRFPSVTTGNEMFKGCRKVKVRQEGGDSVGGEGYMSFSSMVSACEMFESYKGGGIFGNGLFPVCRHFYGCFANAVYDSCELPLLSGEGIAPTGELDCEKMFYYAQCSNHTYVELSSNIVYTDSLRIIADSMFYGAKGKIKCKDSFMRQLSSATYMFYGADLADGGFDDWDEGCKYCYIADGMFMNAKLDNITDKIFPELQSCYNFCANSTVKTVSNLYVQTASAAMFENCPELTQAQIKIGYGNLNFHKLFNYATRLADADIKFILDEAKCTDYSYMFNDCGLLQHVQFSSMTSNNPINLKQAEYAQYMFRNCENLEASDINSVVRSMAYLRNAAHMFEGTHIESYPFFDNGNNGLLPYLENAEGMFLGCTGMTVDFGLIHDKFPALKKGSYMFSLVPDGTGRWYTSLPSLYESVAMFADSAIQHLGGTNLGEVLDFNSLQCAYDMFANCANLTDCYMSLSSLTDGNKMFYNCTTLQTVTLNNLTQLANADAMFMNSNLSYATLHSSGSSYKLSDGDYMFAVKGPLEIEFTSDDTTSIDLFGHCSSAYMMFANGEYYGSETSLGQFDNFKIKGNLFTQGTPPLTNVGGMFNGRKIIDRETAQFIAGVANYCNISSSSQTLGEIFIEDESNLDWFDKWGNWTRYTADEIFSEYAYQTISKNCRAGGQVSMTVFYPKPTSTPYDIVEGSAYIPDASTWYEDNATIGAQVTSVHDGWAWDDNA